MNNTSMKRRLRSAGVASAIFVTGAGIGWQLAGFVLPGEGPHPMVASIRFEDGASLAPAAPKTVPGEKVQHVQQPAGARQQAVESHARTDPTSSVLREEEDRLKEVLRWAERYRQQQAALGMPVERPRNARQRLAVDALGWTEVAENARRFGQGRPVQEVIRAQLEQERAEAAMKQSRLASAAAMAGPALPAAQPAASAASPAAAREDSRSKGRMAHRPRSQSGRGKSVARGEMSRCPLDWLEQAVFHSRSARAG
jgi:hypothetical protein